jgi:hypothetical protein
MAKLTRHTSFKDLKSDSSRDSEPIIPNRRAHASFEEFMNKVRTATPALKGNKHGKQTGKRYS